MDDVFENHTLVEEIRVSQKGEKGPSPRTPVTLRGKEEESKEKMKTQSINSILR